MSLSIDGVLYLRVMDPYKVGPMVVTADKNKSSLILQLKVIIQPADCVRHITPHKHFIGENNCRMSE